MNDRELMGLLLANRRLEIQEIQQRLDRERKDCLPFLRVYEIAQNPDAATEQEKARMATCAHCARAIALMRADLARSAEEQGAVPSVPSGSVPVPEQVATPAGMATGQSSGDVP